MDKTIEYLRTMRDELYDVHENCNEIIEHLPGGEGVRLYYDIYFDEKRMIRVFDPLEVGFLLEED